MHDLNFIAFKKKVKPILNIEEFHLKIWFPVYFFRHLLNLATPSAYFHLGTNWWCRVVSFYFESSAPLQGCTLRLFYSLTLTRKALMVTNLHALDADREGSGSETIRNLKSQLGCPQSQPSLEEKAPNSITMALLPWRLTEPHGAREPSLLLHLGAPRGSHPPQMRDFHRSRNHRLLQRQVFARPHRLDSRQPTNVLGISTTPTCAVTTPNKTFCLAACGFIGGQPVAVVPIISASQSQIKADWGKSNSSCPQRRWWHLIDWNESN